MLDAVYETVLKGEHRVLMIDAPTGCGKTSCISAALAAAPGKIVVAVRTVSQIDIYLQEIERICSNTRQRPEVSYMLGKQKMCPLEDELFPDIYSGCARLREWTKGLIISKLKKTGRGFYDPSEDIVPSERPGERTFCPYYLKSKSSFELDGRVMTKRSEELLETVSRIKEMIVSPKDLLALCNGLCPYEVMSLLAKGTEVVIMNYSHLFREDFQEGIFQWLEMEQDKVTLIIDEAHNLGDAVRSMNTRQLSIRMIDLGQREVERFEQKLGQARLVDSDTSWRRRGVKTINTILPRLKTFIQSRESRMQEGEALLDSDLFREFIYSGIDDIDEALSSISDVAVAIAEMKLAEGDHENLAGDIEANLTQVLLFLMEMEQAEKDPAYQRKVSVQIGSGKRWTRLEVSRIDPSPVIRRMTDNVNATIMLSGTFSPLDAYELYCLGQEKRASLLTLPNPFPAQNRLLLVAKVATTQLDSREDAVNRREITGHIQAVIKTVPGNVAVFFTSYSMMSHYSESCGQAARQVGKKMFIEPRSSEEVPDVLKQFFRQGFGRGGVLLGVCGGKLAEGIDYKGEALNGVAVVGLPLGVFDDIQREINAYFVKKYGREKGLLIAYTLPAINRGLQAAGRVIRAEAERGVILFCDRRFNLSGPGGVRQYLPPWVGSELIPVSADETADRIKEKQIDWDAESGHICR